MRKIVESIVSSYKETCSILTLYILLSTYIVLAEIMIYYVDLKMSLSVFEIAKGSMVSLWLLCVCSFIVYLLQFVIYVLIKHVFLRTAHNLARLFFAFNTFIVSAMWMASFMVLGRKIVFAEFLPERMPLIMKLMILIFGIVVLVILTVRAYKSTKLSFSGPFLKVVFLVFLLSTASLSVVRFMQNPVDEKGQRGHGEIMMANKTTYPHIIVILIDAAMADYFSLYGNKEATTPYMDEFAGSSFVFNNFYPCSNPTLPSVTSMYTSQYPFTHKKYTWSLGYPTKQESIFDVLKDSYDVHFIGISAEPFGFGDMVHSHRTQKVNPLTLLSDALFGDKTATLRLEKMILYFVGYYVTFRNDFEMVADGPSADNGKEVLEILNTVLMQRSKKSLFLHIHLMQLHPPFYRRDSLVKVKPYVNKYLGKFGLPPDVLRDIEDAYKNNLRIADDMVHEIVKILSSFGLADNSIIVITSDHNYFLGLDKNNSAQFHDVSEVPVRRVPLLVKVPGKKGKFVSTLSDHTDISPTLFDLLSLPIPSYMEGRSLLPFMETTKETRQPIHTREYALSASSGKYPMDSFQIIDGHNIFVYNWKRRTGKIFDLKNREIIDPLLSRRFSEIAVTTIFGAHGKGLK